MFLISLITSLQQIPLVDEGGLTIWEFNKGEAHRYFDGADVFYSLWGVALVNSDYGRFFFAVDPFWHRLIYGRQGLKGAEVVGQNNLVRPWDIVASGNRIYVSDKGLGCIAEFRIQKLSPNLPPSVSFMRYFKIPGDSGVTKKIEPRGIAYSNKGYIYVANMETEWGSVLKFEANTGALIDEYLGAGGLFNAGKIQHPVDVAVGKTTASGSVVNTDTIYVLEASRHSVVMYEDDETAVKPRFIKRVRLDPDVRPYTIETDACGNVYVTTDDEQILVYDPGMENRLEIYSSFSDIRDLYITGNELLVSERWTDEHGISLFRITDGCAEEGCVPYAEITAPRDRQMILADSIPVRGRVQCRKEQAYGYIKYWALSIAPGWNPSETDFVALAGGPGGTDGIDTLCWLRADTFGAGNYTLLLRGVGNNPGEPVAEDRSRITIQHGLFTEPAITYLRYPDSSSWGTMDFAPFDTLVEVGWRIVGPAGKLKFKMSTNNGVSYQDISGWLPPGTHLNDSVWQGSWAWNTPDYPSRKIRLLMEVYDTLGQYSSSAEIGPAVVVTSDIGGITAGNGGRKLALSKDGVLHGVYVVGTLSGDTVNPGLEDITNNIYYAYSTDLGLSWSVPRPVAGGRDPAIALFDNGSGGIAYLSDRADTLYYRPINKAGNPGKPTALTNGARSYGSPSITARGGRAFVVAETYSTPPADTVAQANLCLWELMKQGQVVQSANLVQSWQEQIRDPVEVVIISGGGRLLAGDPVPDSTRFIILNPQGSPSVVTDMTGRLHLAWDRGDEVWYGVETDTGWAFVRVSDSGALAHDPCLDVYGGNTYLTWEESRSVLVRKFGFVEDGFWPEKTDTVARSLVFPPAWLEYPVIDKGGAVAWAATTPGPFFRGVNLRQYESETGSWAEAELLSDHPIGQHPQMEVGPQNLAMAWSQGYWEMGEGVATGRFYLGQELLPQDEPPFWWVSLGDPLPTPYTVHRGDYVSYPSGIRADLDSVYLSYSLPMFGPAESEVWLRLYYQGEDDWRGVSVKVNDQEFGNFWYPDDQALWARCDVGMTDSLMIVLNNTGGPEVSLAGVYVYALENGRMETQALGEGKISSSPIVLSLYSPFPNPAKGKAIITYAVPGHQEGEPLLLCLYDVSGRRAMTLNEGPARAGVFAVPIAGGLSSGLYFVFLSVGQEQRVRKLVWLR